jgi:hypothetical protein
MTNVSNRIVTYVYEVNCPADDPAKGPRALGKLVATAQAVDYEWEAVHGIETKRGGGLNALRTLQESH